MHDDDPPLEKNEQSRRVFEGILATPSRCVLVAERDGEVVGTLDLFVMLNLTRQCRPWAGIENFVVDESHRGEGHGWAILDAALSIARDAGCYKVQLVSHARRDAAHALYERHGFTAPVRGYRCYLDD